MSSRRVWGQKPGQPLRTTILSCAFFMPYKEELISGSYKIDESCI
jgi:hypothetical protein